MRLPWRRAAIQQAEPVASGGIVTVDPRRTARPWQDQARLYARKIGVVRFAYGLRAELASSCPLRPEFSANGTDWTPADDAQVAAVLAAYRGTQESQAQLVRQAVWLYDVTGEQYQVIYADPATGRLAVTIRDPLNLERKQDAFLVKDVESGTVRDGTAMLVPARQVRRLWRPDNTWPGAAGSDIEALLEDCARYWALGRYIARKANSRLAANGLLWTPSAMHQLLEAAERGPDGPGRPRSRLEKDYVDIARAAFDESGDENPALMAPFLVNGPGGDQGGGPPIFVDLEGQWSEAVLGARAEALECIARAVPLPAQLVISGPGGGNHWGDWLADEHQLRTISSILEQVAHVDTTETYLRPALTSLAARGVWNGDPDRWRVGFDTSPIVAHPDKSPVAIQLWEDGALNLDALLRSCDFDPVQDRSGPDDLALLAQVMAGRKQGPPGLPADGATTVKAPPALPATLASLSLRPYPAERQTWES